jgi:hypothetical protein
MAIKRVSFCIRADDDNRELFSIGESDKTGELKLFFRRSLYSNFNNKGDGIPAGKLISEQRISIHTSPDSARGINTIKRTYRVGEHLNTGYFYTRAIKEKRGFATLFSRSCPNLSKPHYVPTSLKNSQTVSLGAYNPVIFVLTYSVFVGHPDLEFDWYLADDICYTQHRFAKFRIIVIWSFISLPSTGRGMWLWIQHDQNEREPSFDNGMSERHCVKLHKNHREFLKHRWLREVDEAPLRNELAVMGQFFKYASQETPEYQEWMRKVEIARLFPFPPYIVEDDEETRRDGYPFPTFDITGA